MGSSLCFVVLSSFLFHLVSVLVSNWAGCVKVACYCCLQTGQIVLFFLICVFHFVPYCLTLFILYITYIYIHALLFCHELSVVLLSRIHLLALIFQVVSQSSYYPFPACKNFATPSIADVDFVAKPGHCTWKGQCIENKATGGMFNCYYNGPAVNVSQDAELLKILNETCPWYVKGPEGRDTEVCCDIAQVKQLQNQTGIARSLFARCPACIENFMKHFCFTTCDPDMSLYIEPYTNGPDVEKTVMNCTNDRDEEIIFVESVNVGVENHFGNKLFNSCSNVEYPQQSGKVISLMCGSVDKCTPEAWLTFLGDPGLDYNQAPFLMQYTFLNETTSHGLKPFSTNISNCYDKGSLQCSCSDCPSNEVCPPPLIEKPTSNLFTYITYGVSGAALLSTVVLFLVTMVSGLMLFFGESPEGSLSDDDDRNSSNSSHVSINDGDKDPSPSSSSLHFCSICDFCYGKGLYPLVQIGTWMEFILKALFYRWGIFATRAWFIVLPVTLLAFGGLSVGIMKFTIVTDPVKLWSAPNSQARLEKNYFDQNFGPFYRAEQIIIQAKPKVCNYTMTMPGELHETSFGPVFNWDVLTEVYMLQNDLMNIKAKRENGSIVTLKDICFKPLSPDNNDCTIESVINYFQNNFTRLNYREKNFIDKVNASSHINYCMRYVYQFYLMPMSLLIEICGF